MVLVIVIVALLALFVMAVLNTNPCTTQITGCVYNALKNGTGGDTTVIGIVLTIALVLILAYGRYQYTRKPKVTTIKREDGNRVAGKKWLG
jgi:hypothetical protein